MPLQMKVLIWLSQFLYISAVVFEIEALQAA